MSAPEVDGRVKSGAGCPKRKPVIAGSPHAMDGGYEWRWLPDGQAVRMAIRVSQRSRIRGIRGGPPPARALLNHLYVPCPCTAACTSLLATHSEPLLAILHTASAR